jgi:hypothetical protein
MLPWSRGARGLSFYSKKLNIRMKVIFDKQMLEKTSPDELTIFFENLEKDFRKRVLDSDSIKP